MIAFTDKLCNLGVTLELKNRIFFFFFFFTGMTEIVFKPVPIQQWSETVLPITHTCISTVKLETQQIFSLLFY